MTKNRIGDWMQTATGRQFWPMDPKASEVFIDDIAHSLARICRYNGHCSPFYSVAQHSVLVSSACPPELALEGLLHDAGEAYFADIVRPIKRFLPGVKEIEDKIMAEIAIAYGLAWPIPHDVKQIDSAILADEKAALMLDEPAPWSLPEPPLGIKIVPLPPGAAQHEFLARFYHLSKKRAIA